MKYARCMAAWLRRWFATVKGGAGSWWNEVILHQSLQPSSNFSSWDPPYIWRLYFIDWWIIFLKVMASILEALEQAAGVCIAALLPKLLEWVVNYYLIMCLFTAHFYPVPPRWNQGLQMLYIVMILFSIVLFKAKNPGFKSKVKISSFSYFSLFTCS